MRFKLTFYGGRDLLHPNHRSSVFNALMTYACCKRMWVRQSLRFPSYPCQRVSFQTTRVVEEMYVQGSDCMGSLHSGCGAPLPGDFRVKLQVLPPSHRSRCCPSHCHWTENCFCQFLSAFGLRVKGTLDIMKGVAKELLSFLPYSNLNCFGIMYPRSVFVQMLGEGLSKDTFAVALHVQDCMFILRKSQICSWPVFGADRHCHLHHTFAFA